MGSPLDYILNSDKSRSLLKQDFLTFYLKLSIVLALFLFPTKAKSVSYFEGGNVYYEYLGDGDSLGTNKYKLHFNAYLLCDFSPDSTTVISSLYFGLIHADTLFTPLELIRDSVIAVPNPVLDCNTVPPNTCLNKYFYSTIIDLPISDDSYIFVSSSCCRSVWITNTFVDRSVYYTEITPLAQQLQNNAPPILALPPSMFCNKVPFEISMAETDSEGHQLIYTLCNPFGVNGFDTIPLPPFPLIQYHVPEYSYTHPLGQNVPFSLDPNTGIITGTPDTVGKFTVGICISEYYNGQLLSKTIRDFVFTVNECVPHIDANISNYDEVDNDENTYTFNLCNQTQLTIQNESTDTNYINDYFWVFDINNQLDTFYEWNPTLNFPNNGIYTGQLILNPTQECTDTANIIIHVNELLQADYLLTYDTCIGGEVSFTSQSISQGGEITDWFWDFGDSTNSDAEHPLHQYLQPGNQTTTLIITNEYSCKDTVTKNFEWLPAPPIIVVAPNTFAGCSPLSVYFENLSIPVDSTYDIIWDFGNGEMSTAISPSYIYENEGIFDITVSITSPIGCEIDTTFTSWINVTAAPHADFNWQDEAISNFMPEAYFKDLSTQAIAWKWEANGEVFSLDQNPSFTFQDTGYQTITLTIFDPYNCQDSLTLVLDVAPAFTYFLPNAFSPNGDGVNDIFKGKGFLENIESFEMMIFNRWGQLIFQTNNPEIGWDGKNIKTGKLAPQGVYNCWVKYKAARKSLQEMQQAVVLVK